MIMTIIRFGGRWVAGVGLRRGSSIVLRSDRSFYALSSCALTCAHLTGYGYVHSKPLEGYAPCHRGPPEHHAGNSIQGSSRFRKIFGKSFSYRFVSQDLFSRFRKYLLDLPHV